MQSKQKCQLGAILVPMGLLVLSLTLYIGSTPDKDYTKTDCFITNITDYPESELMFIDIEYNYTHHKNYTVDKILEKTCKTQECIENARAEFEPGTTQDCFYDKTLNRPPAKFGSRPTIGYNELMIGWVAVSILSIVAGVVLIVRYRRYKNHPLTTHRQYLIDPSEF